MKTATRIKALTSLTTAMAVAAPIVVFGFLYVLQVQPARAAAAEARTRLNVAKAELRGTRVFATPESVVVQASALEEFDARTLEGDDVGNVADALASVLNSPSVGPVSNLSVDTGPISDAPRDSMVRVFARPVVAAPITATFDARYEQIGRFFWSLRVLPTTFDLQSVELEPVTGSARLMRAKVSLLAFYRSRTDVPARRSRPEVVDVVTPPQWSRDPFAPAPRSNAAAQPAAAVRTEPDPVITSILMAGGRRIARVDGQVVGRGDRVRNGVIRAIEPDAVVIAGGNGRLRRIEIARPVLHMARR